MKCCLVAGCVCVLAEIRTRVPNAFVCSAKCFHLQHKAHSSLAINAFICSVIACSQVMSNRDYLVASDKFVRLQCDIRRKTSFQVRMDL